MLFHYVPNNYLEYVERSFYEIRANTTQNVAS